MLNLTLVQKRNLVINTCLLFEMYITRCRKFLTYILCKYIKRKFKYNKVVTRTEDCLVTSQSHSTLLIVGRFSPTQFYIWQKTGCGILYFLSFEIENWKCWFSRHYINFSRVLNFIRQQIYNVSP